MNQYTVSADFVEHCGPMSPRNMNYWYNVLAVFNQEGAFKLCIDDKDRAIGHYRKLGERYEPIRFWIQTLLNNPGKKPVIVQLPDGDYDDTCRLFAAIAAHTVSPKRKLVVQDKQKYSHLLPYIQAYGIQLLDGDEAKTQLSKPVIQQYVNGNGNNLQINL